MSCIYFTAERLTVVLTMYARRYVPEIIAVRMAVIAKSVVNQGDADTEPRASVLPDILDTNPEVHMPKSILSPKRNVAPRVRLSPSWRQHTCIDRVIPDEINPARAIAHAVAVSQARSLMATKPLGQLDAGSVIKAKMAVVAAKKWTDGQTVRCRFLDGSPTQQHLVEEKVHIWEQYAKIHFDFSDDPDAEIRISFQADAGSWSAVGTDCLVVSYFPKHMPTMNFGWLKDNTADDEYRRVVVHEFGHALGCIHEHQSPKEHLHWDLNAVYAAFSGPPNYWSKADIDANILEKYSPKGISATAFDAHSIMLYQFDGSLFTDHKGTPLNTELSAHDKQFIRAMYP
jgi:hypothetical protein